MTLLPPWSSSTLVCPFHACPSRLIRGHHAGHGWQGGGEMAQGDVPGTGGAYTYLVGFTEVRSGPGGFQKEAALKLDLGGGRGRVGRGFLEDGRAGALASPRWRRGGPAWLSQSGRSWAEGSSAVQGEMWPLVWAQGLSSPPPPSLRQRSAGLTLTLLLRSSWTLPCLRYSAGRTVYPDY